MDQTTASPIERPVAPDLAQVAFDAPWAWLVAGWRDIRSAPHISLLYGAVFTALSAALSRESRPTE
jgi:hypothetical protein